MVAPDAIVVAFQTHDLLDAFRRDWSTLDSHLTLRVDGGPSQSDWTMQAVADLAAVTLRRPETLESTALGVASLAGYGVGLYPALTDEAGSPRMFEPKLSLAIRDQRLSSWHRAIRATLEFGQ